MKKKEQHPICSVLLNKYCLTKEEFPLALINVIYAGKLHFEKYLNQMFYTVEPW